MGWALRRRVVALMADGQQRTSGDIARLLGIGTRAAMYAMRDLSREGESQELRVVQIRNERKVYVLGTGANVRVAGRREADSRMALERAWPKADTLTQQAMNAMVRAGRGE